MLFALTIFNNKNIQAKSEIDPDVWIPVCVYYEAMGNKAAFKDAILRRCRALMARGVPAWFRDEKLVKQVTITALSLVKEGNPDVEIDLFLKGIVTNARQGPFAETKEVLNLAGEIGM